MLGPKVWYISYLSCLTLKQTTAWFCTIVRTKTMSSETLTWNPTASSASPRGEWNYCCRGKWCWWLKIAKIIMTLVLACHLLLIFQIQSFGFEHRRNCDDACGPGLYVSLGVRWRTFPTDTKHTFGFMCLFTWLKCSFCLSSRHWRWRQVRFLFIQLWAFYCFNIHHLWNETWNIYFYKDDLCFCLSPKCVFLKEVTLNKEPDRQ